MVIFLNGSYYQFNASGPMPDAFEIKCTPHMTDGDIGFLYMMHFVSALPKALEYHEFKG